MDPLTQFETYLTITELQTLRGLDSTAAIQTYLDETPHHLEERNRCPLNVMRDRAAHCFEGALFAAVALRRLGHPPVILDINDDAAPTGGSSHLSSQTARRQSRRTLAPAHGGE